MLNAQKPAENIPGFTFFKADGKAFGEKDIIKNKMVLFVFFDVTCSHCRHAIQSLNRNIKFFIQTDVYLVTLDNRQNVEQFIENNGANLSRYKNVSLLYDLHSEFIKDFVPRKYPGVFLYSKTKKLILYDDNDQALVRFISILKDRSGLVK